MEPPLFPPRHHPPPDSRSFTNRQVYTRILPPPPLTQFYHRFYSRCGLLSISKGVVFVTRDCHVPSLIYGSRPQAKVADIRTPSSPSLFLITDPNNHPSHILLYSAYYSTFPPTLWVTSSPHSIL
eukprot:763468-Hanusia_phi.AAC.1